MRSWGLVMAEGMAKNPMTELATIPNILLESRRSFGATAIEDDSGSGE